PGQLSALLHKRVYEYYPANNTASPDETHDFTYAHDPVGNVLTVFDNSGNEESYFAQDAFGNELPINSAFGASDWGTAAGEDYRITEHQTGKWLDEFTGLYYFHARWYSSEVGRFVGRDPVSTGAYLAERSVSRSCGSCGGVNSVQGNAGPYVMSRNDPCQLPDPSGKFPNRPFGGGGGYTCVNIHETSATFGVFPHYAGFVIGYVESPRPCTKGKSLCTFIAGVYNFGLSSPIDAFNLDLQCCGKRCCVDADEYGGFFSGSGFHGFVVVGGAIGEYHPNPVEEGFCKIADINYGVGAGLEWSASFYQILTCE
ncbi:MAG: hypothetical protein H6616_18310, partial [Ignavibacteria bacterium]|nr:hypothetical protein [Ignavibacteria bacterium]